MTEYNIVPTDNTSEQVAVTKDYLTTAEVGELLGVSRSTTLRLLRKHNVRAIRLGRKLRIPMDEVSRLELAVIERLG